jgi:hypothetical protein
MNPTPGRRQSKSALLQQLIEQNAAQLATLRDLVSSLHGRLDLFESQLQSVNNRMYALAEETRIAAKVYDFARDMVRDQVKNELKAEKGKRKRR